MEMVICRNLKCDSIEIEEEEKEEEEALLITLEDEIVREEEAFNILEDEIE